ncbi:hypothetical protein B0J11DRAFT_600847 [Dendryphion nanum]|uniref:Uncharacterized protein n=1 Tax=Dendryphion nanum TaxID=256645 RepID=A0A9P9E5N2_9PLEO|nr:hypothetical protein B0J11DRAFT_600847 [Dendryphion nanum]
MERASERLYIRRAMQKRQEESVNENELDENEPDENEPDENEPDEDESPGKPKAKGKGNNPTPSPPNGKQPPDSPKKEKGKDPIQPPANTDTPPDPIAKGKGKAKGQNPPDQTSQAATSQDPAPTPPPLPPPPPPSTPPSQPSTTALPLPPTLPGGQGAALNPPLPPPPPPAQSIDTSSEIPIAPVTQTSFITITRSAKGKLPENPLETTPVLMSQEVATTILVVTQTPQIVTIISSGSETVYSSPQATSSSQIAPSATFANGKDTDKNAMPVISLVAQKLLIALGVLGGLAAIITIVIIILKRRKRSKQILFPNEKDVRLGDEPKMAGALEPQYIERRTSILQVQADDHAQAQGHDITAVPQISALEHVLQSGEDAFGTRERTISSAIQSFIDNKQRKSSGYKLGP